MTAPDGSTAVSTAIPATWNGNHAVEVTIPATDVTTEGEYTTTATVTDAAGNVSSLSNEENFIIDDGIDPLLHL